MIKIKIKYSKILVATFISLLVVNNINLAHAASLSPERRLSMMSTDEKIGQLIIAGIDGTIISTNSKKLINKYHVGGFILFKENMNTYTQTRTLLATLKTANKDNGNVPLFLSVDQEGGKVDRLNSIFIKLPTNKTIGLVNKSNVAYSIGQILGKELRALGFNTDFAPVMDVNSNAKNPIIGDRAFGTTPQVVSNLGVQTMKGLASQNIISVIKHFPGHGDTSTDSHTGLPIVKNDLGRLKSIELVPFSNAIKSNVDMIMVAHILFPKIDPVNPASMSKSIITDLLRNTMKFKGVVITDDLTMGAITVSYNIGTAAVKAVNAGCNIVLVCHGYGNEVAVFNALKTAVQKGTISQTTLNNSVLKILKLKQKYNLSDNSGYYGTITRINSTIKALLKKYF